MCQFCLQHGEGKKWYLDARNYSEDLLSDARRRKFIAEFAAGRGLPEGDAAFRKLDKAPAFIRGIITRLVTRKMKKIHFGQVVPLEDVEKIFGFVASIVRVACVCRWKMLKQEKRYCYGISLSPKGGQFGRILAEAGLSVQDGPYSSGAEKLTKEEALDAFRQHEKEGLCHTVWTFHTPFIGGICNCDRADCLAMKATVSHAVPVMFRGEHVAEVDSDRCSGCRECMRACQFGALGYSASNKKAAVDPRWCYGCGICRAMCRKDAITLRPRAGVPAAANIW